MKRLFHIALVDLKIMVKDKSFFFWTLLFPLLFIIIFGNLFQGDANQTVSELMVINQDKGQWGEYLVDNLHSTDIAIQLIDREPEKFKRILIIPGDFSEKIAQTQPQQLLLKKQEDASLEATTRVEMKIFQAIAKIITNLVLEAGNTKMNPGQENFKHLVTLKSHFPAGTMQTVPSGFDHVIPGIMVQFILMMVLIYGGIMVMVDRQKGVLARIMFSSSTLSHLWAGKFLARFLMGLGQAMILVIAGKIFFDLNLGNDWLAFLIVFFLSMAIASLSIYIGSVVNKEDLIVGISILLANFFAALGGCWWPIEVVPPTFRTIAMISPAYWAMDGFHKLIFLNKGFSDIIINIVVFIAFTLIFTFLAIKFFKVKENH